MNKLVLSMAVAIILVSTVSAQAELVNVDFGKTGYTDTYSGAAAVGAAGDTWSAIDIYTNHVTSKSVSDLVDSDGSSTSVDLLVESSDGDNLGAGYLTNSDNTLFRDSWFALRPRQPNLCRFA